MNGIFALILSMSAIGSLLILAILLVDRIAGKDVSRQWQYYIWLVVVARLLVPFGPDLQFGVSGTAQQNLAVWQSGVLAAQLQEELPQLEEIDSPGGDAQSYAAQSSAAAGTGSASANASDPWTQAMTIAGIVWACGCAILLTRRITAYQSFQKYVRAGMVPCADPARLDVLADAAALCGVRRPVEIAVNPLISSPMLVGLIHPCIVLPDETMSDDEFRYIALHELTHLHRLDLVYKWCVQLAVCVHWFNPLVYLMEKRIRRACEFSCDEAVVRRDGPDSAIPYGMTLLNAMASAGTYSEPVGSVNLSENKRLLKERLGKMQTYTQKRKLSAIVLSVLVTVCLVATTACSGVYRHMLPGRHLADSITPEHISVDLGDVPADGVISLDVRDCAVRIMETAAEDARISASYDPRLFTARMSGSTIACDAVPRSDILFDAPQILELFLPAGTLDTISLNARDSFIAWDSVPRTEIVGTAKSSMTLAEFPKSYDGMFSMECPDGYVVLQSADEFAGTAVQIQANYISAPPEFASDGGMASLDSGDGGQIYVEAPDGVITIGGDGLPSHVLDRLDSLSSTDRYALAEAFADGLADRIEEGSVNIADRFAAGAESWAAALEEAFADTTAPPAPDAPGAPDAPHRPEPSADASATLDADASTDPEESAGRSARAESSHSLSESVHSIVSYVLSSVADALHTAAAEIRSDASAG